MPNYIQDFSNWLRNEDKGDKTVTTYESVMKMFVVWYEQSDGKEFVPQDVTALALQDYRSFLQSIENRKPATINKALATLKTFFGWALEVGHVNANPALKVRMKRVQQSRSPKWLTVNAESRLLGTVDAEKNLLKQTRDRAIILTMLLAGLRVEEVSVLRIRDIDLKDEYVTVTNGKGGKYRRVPMQKDLKKALKTWLGYRSNADKPEHQSSDYLFVSERAGRITTRAIAYIVDGYLKRCGLLERSKDGKKLEGQYSCHSLRHTFCKRLVDAGWKLQDVAKLAGHDSIQTTTVYVEPSQDELKRKMQAM